MNSNKINIEKLRNELQNTLPGYDAQLKMSAAPSARIKSNPGEKSKKAGVLIPLYYKKEMPYISFIRRAKYEGVHSNQISFPGGKYEENDSNITETALREAEEEIGINAKKVDILGKLTQLYIPISNYLVTPIVGFCKEHPAFVPDQTEVEEVVEINLFDLLSPECKQVTNITEQNYSIRVPAFIVDKTIIWGATAMILSEFLEVTNLAIPQ